MLFFLHHGRAADLSICVCHALLETPAGWGWNTVAQLQKCEVSYQLHKSTLNWLSNGTLVLRVILWCLKQGKPLLIGNPNIWKQTLRITSKSYKRWPPLSHSGGHTVTFSYPLMAEIVSSLFPLPHYITLSYSCLMKKPFTSNGALQYVQDWSNKSSELTKKKL